MDHKQKYSFFSINFFSAPGIQFSQQKSTDSDSENKNRQESKNANKEKCQRLIDYTFGNGPYPVSDITGLPDSLRDRITQTLLHEHINQKEKTEEVVVKPTSNIQEFVEKRGTLIKITPVNPVKHIKLSTLQTSGVDKVSQRNFDVCTKRIKNLKPVTIWRFYKRSKDKLLFYDPEKAEATAKEVPLKPDLTDITEKSKNEQQSYEVEKIEEISKENHLKPGLDSGGNPDITKNERSYDTEKIETAAKKAKLEQELHHFRETGTLEMQLEMDNLFKKDVAMDTGPLDLGLNRHPKCSKNQGKKISTSTSPHLTPTPIL